MWMSKGGWEVEGQINIWSDVDWEVVESVMKTKTEKKTYIGQGFEQRDDLMLLIV
jgi:hypothetical protein